MKHGPIALIDEQLPVVAIAPHDHVFEKMWATSRRSRRAAGGHRGDDAGDGALHELLDPAEDCPDHGARRRTRC